MVDTFNFGHLIEGTVEQDPLTDRYMIRTVDRAGQPVIVNLDTLFAKFVGQDVRFTLASFEGLVKLAAMVEGAENVTGIPPEAFPAVPFDIQRKIALKTVY